MNRFCYFILLLNTAQKKEDFTVMLLSRDCDVELSLTTVLLYAVLQERAVIKHPIIHLVVVCGL